MKRNQTQHFECREKVLAEAIRELATELRMIDVIDFVSYIRLDKFSHIEALVNAAAELYYRSDTLKFGSSADVHMDWGTAPTIWLDMEFANNGIRVYFSLVLESCEAAVQIEHIEFLSPSEHAEINTGRLVAAIADARRGTPDMPARSPAMTVASH